MSTTQSTDDHLAPLLEYFAERLNRVFAYFFCVLEFENDQDAKDTNWKNARAWSLKTIRNGCLHASLIAIRDLDDFLTPRTPSSRPDDLKASDFGYPQSHGFLATSEREAINKRIAHTTTAGVTAQEIPWDIWELTSKCVAQSLQFLKWTEDHFTLSHFNLYTAARICREITQRTHDHIAAEVAKRKS